MTRFVILSAPRSGSNMLSSLLNSHTSILCHHEIFNPDGIFYALPLRDSEFSIVNNINERDNDPQTCLDNIWRFNNAKPCVGFKMTHKQNIMVFNSVLNDKRVKKIILIRKNQIKTHVSKLLAQQSGIWEQYDTPYCAKNSPSKKNKVSVCLQELKNDIAFNECYYDEIRLHLKKSKQEYIEVEYDNLNETDTQQRLLNYLHLEKQELVTHSIKQNSSDLRKKISNYSKLLDQCPKALIAQLTETST